MFNASRDFDYELNHHQSLGDEDENTRRKTYRRGRSFRSSRRRSRKAAASPGVGMSGRRNRRWSW